MREIIRKFTCSQPKQMIRPTVFLTIENMFIVFPSVATLFAIQFIVSAFSGNIDYKALWATAGYLGVMFLLQAVVSITAHRNTFLPAAVNCAENKTRFIDKLRTLPLGYFQKRRSGELINNFTGDFLALEQSMVGMFTGIFSVVFSCVLTSIFFFAYNSIMAAAFYGSVVVAVIILVLSGSMSTRLTQNSARARDVAAGYLSEYLQGMKVLKSYNQTGKGFEKLKNAYEALMKTNLKTEAFVGTLVNGASSVANMALPIICFVGAYLVLGGSLDIASYLAIIIVGTKILMPIMTYIRYMIVLRIHHVAAQRIDKVFSNKSFEGSQTIDAENDIVFNKVNFAYDGNLENCVLKEASFTIPKGKFTAIVGPSGSGKSTILRLIARFWDVTEGEITIGGTELKNANTDSWMQNISMVLQEVYLFNETVRENLLFGREDISDEEMIAAAKKAQCHEFIVQLPGGYDTIIGEGGCTLSGGEKQRISIARAILKNAPILLLDEPTASLDAKNEVLVQRAIAELVKNKTVIMIAHRLKTIKNADQILLVSDGRIVENGKHDDLLKAGGIYTKLWNIQSAAFEFKF